MGKQTFADDIQVNSGIEQLMSLINLHDAAKQILVLVQQSTLKETTRI